MTQTHTSLPWAAYGRYIGTKNHMSYVGEVRDENGNWSDTVKSRGDAAFIVTACNSYYDNQATIASQAAEIAALRGIINKSASALGNGAYVSEGASIEFMRGLPEEIKLVVADLRSRAILSDRSRSIAETGEREATPQKLSKGDAEKMIDEFEKAFFMRSVAETDARKRAYETAKCKLIAALATEGKDNG